MFKRKQNIIVVVSFMLTLGLSLEIWSALGGEKDGDVATNIVAGDGSKAGVEVKKKKGNRFGRFFKAPFKAMGKVFGEHEKKAKVDDGKKKVDAQVVDPAQTVASKLPEAKGDIGELTTVVETNLTIGRNHLNAGRVNEAITFINAALSYDNESAAANNLMGVAMDKKGYHYRAIPRYEMALKKSNQQAEVLNNLGYSLYLTGHYRASAEKLKEALRLSPNNPRVLNNLALAQSRLGKYDQAVKHFVQAGGTFKGHLNAARIMEHMGRQKEAIAQYEKALAVTPSSTFVLGRLADLYKREGRVQKSEQAWRAYHQYQQRVETDTKKVKARL